MFSTIKSVLKIFAWFTDRYESVKTKIKKYRKRRYEKKVEKAVDNLDNDSVIRLLQSIRKKRANRRNQS